MRTTVEIPDSLREKLVTEAARRGEKGYSAVIERALRKYFGGPAQTKAEIARQLRGCEKEQTTLEAEHRRVAAVREGRRRGDVTLIDTSAIARRAATLFTDLRALGITIDNEDLLIGATALERGVSLLTCNSAHFAHVTGLRLE